MLGIKRNEQKNMGRNYIVKNLITSDCSKFEIVRETIQDLCCCFLFCSALSLSLAQSIRTSRIAFTAFTDDIFNLRSIEREHRLLGLYSFHKISFYARFLITKNGML